MKMSQFAKIDRKTKKILEVTKQYSKPDNTADVVYMPIKASGDVVPEDLHIMSGYMPVVNYAKLFLRREKSHEEKSGGSQEEGD